MFKIGQLIRCSKISTLTTPFLSYRSVYQIDNIIKDKLYLSYTDGYQPRIFRLTGFEPQLFSLIPNKPPYPLGTFVVLLSNKYNENTDEGIVARVAKTSLTLYHRYAIIEYDNKYKDIIIIIDDKGKRVRINLEYFKPWEPPKNKFPSWL